MRVFRSPRDHVCLLVIVAGTLHAASWNRLAAEDADRQSVDQAASQSRQLVPFQDELLRQEAGQQAQARQVRLQPRYPVATHGTVVLADRRLLQQLGVVRELLKQEKFPEALPALQQILETAGDSFFYPDPEQKTNARSLKAEIREMIAGLPDAGRRAYELQFGATARGLLNEAVEAGEPARLGEIARRYLHTEAGLEAQYRLAVWHYNRGEPLAASLGFERVRAVGGEKNRWDPLLSVQLALAQRDCGNLKAAIARLDGVAAAYDSSVRLPLAGRDVRLPEKGGNADEWLKTTFARREAVTGLAGDWLMPGGNSARNPVWNAGDEERAIEWPKEGVATVFDPLKAPDDPSITELDRLLLRIAELIKRGRVPGPQPTLPQGEPVIANDTIVIRTVGNLRAVSVADGNRRWETLADETVELLMTPGAEGIAAPVETAVNALALQRITRDSTFGHISSDGRRLFAIEDLGFATSILVPPLGAVNPPATNRLAAYDLRTGKLAWEVGGGTGPFALELAGSFFLGAPLPLSGKLYVLAEADREIRLLVLDAQEGTLEWAQPLLAVDHGVDQKWQRRTAGLSPAYGEGVLVCPTAAGFVIGVDVMSRSLLWLHRLPDTGRPVVPFPGDPLPRPAPPNPNAPATAGWHGVSMLVREGRVLLANDQPKSLVCLGLADGKPMWSVEKFESDPVSLVGVWEERVLIAGEKQLEAFALADGTSAWNKGTPYADGHRLSGRGVIVDGRGYLPFAKGTGEKQSGSVGIFDAATGRTVGWRNVLAGRAPGNLAAVPGHLVSQGLDRIDVFARPRPDRDEMAGLEK